MSAPRDELRTHLNAVIEAARELPEDDREHLADVFLNELERGYALVPRSELKRNRGLGTARPFGSGSFARTVLTVFLIGAALLVLMPILFGSLFVLAHVPFLLIAIILFFIFRSRGPWSRRGMYRW